MNFQAPENGAKTVPHDFFPQHDRCLTDRPPTIPVPLESVAMSRPIRYQPEQWSVSFVTGRCIHRNGATLMDPQFLLSDYSGFDAFACLCDV